MLGRWEWRESCPSLVQSSQLLRAAEQVTPVLWGSVPIFHRRQGPGPPYGSMGSSTVMATPALSPQRRSFHTLPELEKDPLVLKGGQLAPVDRRYVLNSPQE